MLLSLILSMSAWAEHPLLGQTFESAPAHLGPLLANPPEPSVDAVREHVEAHDLQAALWEANRVTEDGRWGNDRMLAYMVQGVIHREAGRHNLASAAFTKVRSSKNGLGPMASYLEAEQDLERGRYFVAAKECDQYRKDYPEGRYFHDCQRVMALAYARAGSWSNARSTAADYDKANKDAPIGEQIELTLTLQLLRENPDKAVPRLQELALSFSAPLTGRVAAEELEKLRLAGNDKAVVPNDLESRKRRAYSLRGTKQTHQAWRAYADLVMDTHDDDPALTAWLEGNAETFGWRARNWAFLADWYSNQYREDKSPRTAWQHFRTLSRGGRYAEARLVAIDAMKEHGKSGDWRNSEEERAKMFMLAKDYTGAKALYDEMAKTGGWTGLRGKFFAAFSSFMSGTNDADTRRRLDELIAGNGSYAHAALYWRSRLHDRMGKTEAAHADRLAVIADDADTWYAALARATDTKGDHVDRRDGTWAGTPFERPPVLQGELPPSTSEDFALARPRTVSVRKANAGFGLLSWGQSVATPEVAPATTAYMRVDPDLPPASKLPITLFDPRSIHPRFKAYASKHEASFPDLTAAYELARAGLYNLSGPLFSAIYEDWRKAYSRGGKQHAAARAMKLSPGEWRDFFAYTRDHHHTARFNHKVWTRMDVSEEALAAKRVAYPLAHDRYVWEHARENDVDPYLILGLMRQESTYNSIARSPVGARGAMQIMPTTGHLVANIQNDLHFDAGDLEDPIFSVGYGIKYLGLLLDRFDGVYPLAIASYNGGPFNMSSWLQGTGMDMPIDAVVEHIPYSETRDYVKKVSGGYSTYLALYAPPDTILDPPDTPLGDHPEIVDF